MQVVMDFETRSAIEIKTRGAFVYAADPSTEIMCLSVAIDAREPIAWAPKKFRTGIACKLVSEHEIVQAVTSARKTVAQNSMFEYLIWNIVGKRLGWPNLPLEKLHDTMAQLGYCALPQNLEQAAQALGLRVQKDLAGHAVMMKLCKPRKPRKAEREADPDWASRHWWHEDPEDIETLIEYCKKDVDVERLVHHALPPLPEKEREIWLLDQRINLRGVKIDRENVQTIIEVTSARETKQLARFQQLTGGAVSGPRSYVALKNWVNEQTGLQLVSIDANTTDELLKRGDIPQTVREVLQIKAELAKSSVAKFKAMTARVNEDSRIRGLFRYGGASTLRWAAKGVQPHNLPRDSYGPETWEHVLDLMIEDDLDGLAMLYDDPFFVASRCVRGAFISDDDKDLVCADFSAVEGRGLAHIAGEQWVVEAYARGEDLYKFAASDLFGVPYDKVNKDQRQIGKVEELFLGYGGGIGAFQTGALGYGIDLEKLPALIFPRATADELDGPYGARALAKAYVTRNPDSMSLDAAIACDIIKRKWRFARPNICQFWRGLEEAAYQAIENPGQVYSYRTIRYCCHNNFLKCLMPSGRVMHYYQPRIKPVTTTWEEEKLSITYWGMKVVDGKTTRQWARIPTYGGKLAENVTQGFCRDLLAWSMLRLEKSGYPIVFHVHDEAVGEVPAGTADLDKFSTIMSEVPYWAAGMPVKAAGWVGKRYRK